MVLYYHTEIYKQSKLVRPSLCDTYLFPLMINWPDKCQMGGELIILMLMIITNATFLNEVSSPSPKSLEII